MASAKTCTRSTPESSKNYFRWTVVLEPVKLVSNGNLVLSALREEIWHPGKMNGERRRKRRGGKKKRNREPVNWDRCTISMGAPRTCGRRPGPGNREKGSYAGSGLTMSDERVQVFDLLQQPPISFGRYCVSSESVR